MMEFLNEGRATRQFANEALKHFETMPSPFVRSSSRSLSPGSWAKHKSTQWRVATWRRKKETGPAQ